MDLPPIIARMERFPAALAALLSDLRGEDLRWRPPGDGWSLLEILGHLADEETDDFRTRIESTLRDAGAPWPPIDPERAVRERRHQEADPARLLQRLRAERGRTVEKLRELAGADWSATHQHPSIGPLRAGDVLASFAAHDALHLRQVARRLFDLARRDAAGYDTAYAGDW